MPDLAQILEMLERDGALDLRPQPDTWPVPSPNEQIAEVDHDRLFPPRRPLDRGETDYEVYGDEWEIDQDRTEEILSPPPTGGFPGPPEWDVWAWYCPIHFFGPEWGIYIREAGLVECARRIGAYAPPTSGWSRTLLAKAVVRAAFSTLFLHEHYHHKTESLALRLHVVEQRPVFPPYFTNAYRAALGTDDLIEEGLANVDSYRRITSTPYATWTGQAVTNAAKEYLRESFRAAPPGYHRASLILDLWDNFSQEQNLLFALVQEGTVAPLRGAQEDFSIATHLNHSLFSIKQRIYTVLPPGVRSVLPTRGAVAPLATRSLSRFIKGHGFTEVPGGGKGSHQMFRDSSGRMIVLPTRKDVSPPVLRSTAETLGLRPRDLVKAIEAN